MNLSADMQRIFTDEISFVVRKMKEAEDAATKLYFFSAVYGVASRIMNIEFDPELAFIHYVLNSAYTTINGRVVATSAVQEKGAGIPEKLFDRLEEALEEMIAKIQQGEKTYSVLETISKLAYSTTGNGYYLYLKGLLSI